MTRIKSPWKMRVRTWWGLYAERVLLTALGLAVISWMVIVLVALQREVTSCTETGGRWDVVGQEYRPPTYHRVGDIWYPIGGGMVDVYGCVP